MVATFVGLKLRLLANSFNGKPQQVMVMLVAVMFGIGILATGVFAVGYLWIVEPNLIEPWVIISFSATVLGWHFFPLLVGATDGTIDPSKLAHLPLARRDWVSGLLTAAMVGVAPVSYTHLTLPTTPYV